MGRKRFAPDDPREWLNRARSNLAHAGATSPDVLLEDLCFDAQQAAEKAIKAIFISRDEEFPYIHELKKLLRRLGRNGLKIPKYVWQADKLTPFAAVMHILGKWIRPRRAIPPRGSHRDSGAALG